MSQRSSSSAVRYRSRMRIALWTSPGVKPRRVRASRRLSPIWNTVRELLPTLWRTARAAWKQCGELRRRPCPRVVLGELPPDRDEVRQAGQRGRCDDEGDRGLPTILVPDEPGALAHVLVDEARPVEAALGVGPDVVREKLLTAVPEQLGRPSVDRDHPAVVVVDADG